MITWNLETVGTPGSAPYQAVAAVLGRIDAEVVAIQEVAGATDARHLQALARQLGYPYVEIPPGGPFGALRNALLSDFPITRSTLWTAALLSGTGCAMTPSPISRGAELYLRQSGSDGGGSRW
ncbi:MAG: endonuclease/exonuclease/phosphatase family protein [Chromatiaceae bacterium]